jgi:membrane associated rhomboid family serine protease
MAEKSRWYSVKLSIAIAIIFVLNMVFYDFFFSNFALISSEAFIKPWMFVTHMFLHSGYLHLIYNLIALLLFGSILERVIGSKNFIAIFFITGIISGIAAVFFYNAAVGASGAIFGVMGCLAVLRPRMPVWIYGVPMPMIIAIVVWAGVDVFGMLVAIPGDNIAHASHLFGMVIGIAAGLWVRGDYKEHEKKEVKYEIISDHELEEWEEKYM